MLRVIVAGSRDFNNFQLLEEKLNFYLQRYQVSEIEIVSGCARGADKLGEKYAVKRGIIIKKFPADWQKFGKSAGYKRNEEMAKYSSHCIVFWDGMSKGSYHMINLAKQYNLKLRVVRF